MSRELPSASCGKRRRGHLPGRLDRTHSPRGWEASSGDGVLHVCTAYRVRIIHFQAKGGDRCQSRWCGPVQGKGVGSAGGEGGREGDRRDSLTHTVCCLFTIFTPANGITCSHTEVGVATRLKFVVEFELLPFPTEDLHELTCTVKDTLS